MTPVPFLAVVPAVLVVALAAGCGQQVADQSSSGSSGSGASSSASSGPVRIGTCDPDDPAVTGAPVVARADLDGDGRAEEIRRTTASGCAGYLVAVVDGRLVGAATEDPSLPLKSVRAVTLPGRTGQVLVAEGAHPRGGRSTSVLAYGEDRLVLLKRPGGSSLMPFQPTDTVPATSLLSLACGPQSTLVLREAVEHQPVGIIAAFDVRQTTFRLRGTELVSQGTREIADNVLPAELPRRFPAIDERRVLADGCG